MAPLSEKIEVAITVDDDSFTLLKCQGSVQVSDTTPNAPNITFRLPAQALTNLLQEQPPDIPQMGIAILRLLISHDPNLRAHARVHAGLFDLARLGYLSVLASGGAPFMRFLASRGLTNMNKIRNALTQLRDKNGK